MYVCDVFRPPKFLVPGGQTFLTHRREGGGQTFLHQGGDEHFMLEAVVAMMNDDVDKEMDVRKVNVLESEASKLSAGAGIFRGQ